DGRKCNARARNLAAATHTEHSRAAGVRSQKRFAKGPRSTQASVLFMHLSAFFRIIRSWTYKARVRVVVALSSASMLALGQWRVIASVYAQDPPPAQAQPARPAPNGCRVTGKVVSGTTPLPGVSIVVHVGEAVKAATSTDADGKFVIIFGPNSSYHVS